MKVVYMLHAREARALLKTRGCENLVTTPKQILKEEGQHSIPIPLGPKGGSEQRLCENPERGLTLHTLPL